MVYNWINKLQIQVYPAVCVLCGSKGEQNLDLCKPCQTHLPRNLNPCSCCAQPLPVRNSSQLCGQCSRQRPPFQRVYAPFLYQPPVDHLIQAHKFRQQLANGRLLGKLLADYLLEQNYEPPQLILPVPLQQQQLQQRGFNQSAELTRQLAAELKLKWSSRLLHKIRRTQPQHGLDQKQRMKNLRHCFEFYNRKNLHRVALVDDVVTTGSTASEITRTLNQQGVEQVQIWALARTP